jgi:DNA polymerase III delta prime subunit
VGVACAVGSREELLGTLLGGGATGAAEIRVEADDPDLSPPRFGALHVSTAGDEARIKRQEAALERVVAGRSTLPDLLGVLEGQGREQRTAGQLRPLSTGVERQLRAPLSIAQQSAIKCALNTPDLALIQGPPGTGKTTVIRAIAQRLHEEGRQPVLVCSHQHEAVLNVIEGMTVGGLPIPRIGGRRGEDLWTTHRHLWRWVEEVAGAAEQGAASLHAPAVGAVCDRLWRERRTWEATPRGQRPVLEILRRFDAEAGAHLSVAARTALLDAIARAEARLPAAPERDPEERRQTLGLLRRQRRSEEAWADDGPALARRLAGHLRGAAWLAPSYQEALDLAGAQPPNAGLPVGWAPLLDAIQAACEGQHREEDRGLEGLAEAAMLTVLEDLEARAICSGEGLGDALLRLADRLRSDPDVVEKLIQRHATVLGSTASQAAGKVMHKLHPTFDTLIVDEAARASPLDLLVPLARARRIILVGDQMQLPHMLEPAVEATYEAEGAQEAVERLREGLFQRLWGRYAASPPGGIQRCVVLDVQHRMHPTIGSLVSRCFYAGSLKNGVEAEARPPVLSLSSHPIFCVDVPNRSGPEKASARGSRYRPVEIDVLVDKLRILNEQEPPDLTVGVISFYSEQISQIQSRLAEEGLEHRAEVGTVDAFQGRDFDVVLLSCVRSGRGVGFLALPNRLNVAMSRAKRLLGVIGDRATISVIPAFAELLSVADLQTVSPPQTIAGPPEAPRA